MKVANIRGYAAYETHDSTIVDRWNDRVAKDDLVYVLGDLSAGGGTSTRYALHIMKSLKGRKRLIAGNHDPIHPMNRESPKWFPYYMDVFESVCRSMPFSSHKYAARLNGLLSV